MGETMTIPFRAATLFLSVSAVLHLFAFVVGGLQAEALQLIPIGVLYLLLVIALSRGMRWLAYVVFIGIAVAGIFAMTRIWSPGDVPGWWYGAIVAANFLCAASLFVGLWRAPAAMPDA